MSSQRAFPSLLHRGPPIEDSSSALPEYRGRDGSLHTVKLWPSARWCSARLVLPVPSIEDCKLEGRRYERSCSAVILISWASDGLLVFSQVYG